MLTRTCIKCGCKFDLDPQEIADGTYSPLCDTCLRESCENNLPPTPERPIAEID